MNHSLNTRELCTVLAALRNWQRTPEQWRPKALAELASNGHNVEPLTLSEVDQLYARLII